MTEPERLAEAARLMIEEFRDKTRWQGELEESLAEVRREREEIARAVEPILRGIGGEAARRLRRRMDAATYALTPPPSRIARTPRARAALEFLSLTEHETLRAAELNFYLRRRGFDCAPRYAAKLLEAWRRKGIVVRVGHGTYRVVLGHPEVARLRLIAIDVK